MTIELTILSIIFGTILGLILALMKISSNFIVSKIAGFYIYIMRGTPLLLQLFTIYYGLPSLGIKLNPFPAAVIGMSLNSAAYVAEIIRGGIQSIDKGQMEAAKALGMTYLQAMKRIILPQAYRRLIPPMGNEFIALLKDSSLVSTIAMVDLMRTALQMYSNSFKPVEVFTLAGLYYLLLTSIFTLIFGKMERRYSVYE
ncbi:amino acid ABC transporter membrane protein, PAAT family (TC 3.A.1.3.-) [Caldanaerobius fijiensis DSM 17918]|uniref:Amino acid ABC transporter membrane protein, PAAT family (TC 3.A.1.3.-) n=2 Tax=Caldanaerobius TaxID=862261 RepID=A0A1M4X7T1_9THEO|nr:amino acid ABC transporter membrane protein, PAAT family (TC 3.A.1.3.-) [Caldanaerobius fijiensis DSM 17918]